MIHKNKKKIPINIRRKKKTGSATGRKSKSRLISKKRTKRVKRLHPLQLPARKTIAAIVTATNGQDGLRQLLKQLRRLAINELIIVVNDSANDELQSVCREFAATMLPFANPIGPDVGRAIGAKRAQSDILLFLDGGQRLKAEQLVPFIRAVDKKADVALNDISPSAGLFSQQDTVTRMSQFFNICLNRKDLRANTLNATPHALTKKASETIGPANLAVPSKAHAIAIWSGLRVTVPTAVAKQIHGAANSRPKDSPTELIIGDEVEALAFLANASGPRLNFPDVLRKRHFL
jgi:hypothetical protein